MKRNILFSSLLGMLFGIGQNNAQTYVFDHQTQVTHGASTLKFPFAGGLNTPQFSSTDLNHDGLNDLFIFDRTGNKVLTFINEGGTGVVNYFYWPDYELLFPPLLNWAILLDYNCDGEEDIITSTGLGAKTYLATYDGFSLSYSDDQNPIKFNEAGFEFDLGIGYIDIPGFADINFDGDLDVLNFNLAGGIVDYYENRQIEEGLDCGVWELEHVNSCWGNFYESGITYSVDLGVGCKGVTNRSGAVHAGSTFMIFDQDADNDYDLVLGDLAFGNLNFLVNGGDKDFANIVDQDTTYPSNTLPYDVQIFPAPFLIDMNNDGRKDMMVAPNNENLSENFKNVWYYENVSVDDTYIFEFQTDSLLVSDMIDVGDRAFPAFFDYNYDGLMDIVIGNKGYYNDGGYDSKLALYENIGTAAEPAFKLITRDFGGLGIFDFKNICPAFSDLDDDGDIDMLIGEDEGAIHFFKNTAPPEGPAEFILFAANYQGIDPGKNAAPQLIDITGDGLEDLILGEQNGNLNFYLNTGELTDPVFTLQNEFWGNVDVRATGSLTGHSVPELIKIGDEYVLFVGCEDGTIYKYIPTADFSGSFTEETSFYNQTDEGTFTTVRFFDITGDGILEMITGNERGGVTLYRDETTVEVAEPVAVQFEILLYPNPSQQIITLEGPGLINFNCINLYDLTGRLVQSVTGNFNAQIEIYVGSLSNGMYLAEGISTKTGERFRIQFIKN